MSTTPDMSREEIEALLVFLANGTLEGPERAAVEAAVEADPHLARELEALKAMRARMQDEEVEPSPGEMGLARLMRDIDRETAQPAAANQPGAPQFWKIAAVLAFGLFVAQSAYFGYMRGPEMQLAGGDDAPVATPAEHGLTVAFAGTATEADIRALLISLDLVIVDGPSALGLYTLAAPDAEARAAALEVMQTRPQLVESVE